MAGNFRHAGIHWPSSAGGEHPNRDFILDAFPGVREGVLTILADSARYHYDAARQRGGLVIWRALARPGRKPAQVGWDPRAAVDEVLNLWDEAPHGGDELFTPWNELQFGIESGGTFPGFRAVAQFLDDCRPLLRQEFEARGHTVRLVWPAWGPDQPYMDAPFDKINEWVNEANQWDVFSAHVYSHDDGDPSHSGGYNVARTHGRWRDYFGPVKPIVYTEWNANHTIADDRDMLESAGTVCAGDPNCLGFTYYTYETRRDGEEQLSIWGNQERMALFQNPPALPEVPGQGSTRPGMQPEPEPEPLPTTPPPLTEEPPVPEPTAVPDSLPQGLDVSNNNGDVDWDVVKASGIVFAASKITEGTWFRDGWFADNWSEKKRLAIARLAYDFARPSRCGAHEEAQYFLDAFEILGCSIEAGDIMALDLEDPDVPVGVDLSAWAYTWCRHVEGALGYKPIVYTSPGYIEDHKLYNEPRLGEYGLWAANWQANFPPAPRPWQIVAFWQNGVYDSWPGVVGQADHDFFNGPESSIRLYGKPSSAAPHQDEPTPSQPPVDVSRLQTLVGVAYNEDGEIIPPLRRISGGKLKKAEMQSEAQGIIGFLQSNRP